jgi:putative sterol carrier protein
MDVKSPREFFEEVLPKRFNPAKAAGVDVIVQLSITGPEGGNWIVTTKDQKLEIKEGIHPSPTLSLKMTEKDYLDLINHKLSAEKAFMTGKLQFKGNIVLAMKLRDMGFL